MNSTRWMTFGEQCGTITSDLTPLLGEIVDSLHRNLNPTLILFVGNASSRSLREHIGSPTLDEGSVHLQLGKALSGWGSAERAICAFGSAVAKEVSVEEHNHGHVIEWDQRSQAPQPHRLATIHSRLLSPFFDVVCIFLSSFPSIDAFGDYLASWVLAHATHNSKGALNIMPRLVVVVEETAGSGAPGSGHKTTIDPTKLKELLQEQTLRKTGVPVDEAFCALHVRLLSADTCVLRGRQYMKLLNFLRDQSSSARRDKRRQRTNFDARHIVDLFGQAYRCLLADSTFDPLVASRRSEPIPTQSDERIGMFLSALEADKSLPFLASAMHLHACPEGSHRFSFLQLFNALYRPTWRRAAQAAGLGARSQGFLEHQLVPAISSLPDGSVQIARRHICLTKKLHADLKNLKNNAYCPLCILRRPEYPLPCGHMYCEADLRLTGQLVAKDTIAVTQCVLCRQTMTAVVFRFRNKSRGIRVLALDGGGVRGIMLLECLRVLESMVQVYLPGMPIIELFDVCAGTSSGGICVLTLAHKGTPVREAIRSFERLSRRVFAKKSIWRRALNVLFHGSLYCNKAINEALTLHYGDSTLSDYSPATARGAKLVITAKGTPCKDYVLTNFNGAGDGHARDHYEHALPAPRSRGVATWEAARATSAAPGFFTPHTIDGVGTFQDGGLWQNNPLAVALTEARAIWQSMARPDVCLSIGTGYQRNPKTQPTELDMSRQASTSPAADCSKEEHAAQLGWRWKVSLVAVFLRVIYALMDTPTMDGDKCHHYVSRGAPAGDSTNAQIVRLNADLGVAAPRLDDLSCMDNLRQEAIRQYQDNPQLQQTADLLISSLFYLEIIDRPVRRYDHVTFQGRILCDISPGEQLQRLIQVLQEYKSKFEVNGRALSIHDVKTQKLMHSHFELAVNGTVAGLGVKFEIYLVQDRDGAKARERISRSPFSLEDVMEFQGWDCPLVQRPTKGGKRKRDHIICRTGRAKRAKT